MLTTLSIKNYAIIESLIIDFDKRLNIITGETGAGKSILLGAMGLIMGKRADTKSLLNEENKCIVEASFSLRKKKLKPFFKKHDLDYDEELIIRREIAPSGKSRAFVNDTPVKLKLLQELSANLIDLHQQFDNLDIHNDKFQLELIDALAGNEGTLSKYRGIYKAFKSNKIILNDLIERSQNASKESDFIRFQLAELTEASLTSNEQSSLEEEQKKLQSAEDIKSGINTATLLLHENDDSILSQLKTIRNNLEPFQTMSEALKRVFEQVKNAIFELDDAASTCTGIRDDIEYSPERINEIQNRLDLIYKLQKKHHVDSVAELINLEQNFSAQLKGFGDISETITAKQLEIEKQQAQLEKIAAQLSKERKIQGPKFSKKVEKLLSELGMPNAKLTVDIKDLEAINAAGNDKIEFLFKANKGGKFQAIRDVASGGEIARLNLSTKSIVAGAMDLPTLIFDEIDTGISGDVALKMGGIIKNLANKHQVISITHSPQVASHADAHIFVFKKDEKGQTNTHVKVLSEKERIKELATMLSKKPPSDSAIENAKELLNG